MPRLKAKKALLLRHLIGYKQYSEILHGVKPKWIMGMLCKSSFLS